MWTNDRTGKGNSKRLLRGGVPVAFLRRAIGLSPAGVGAAECAPEPALQRLSCMPSMGSLTMQVPGLLRQDAA